MDPRKPPNPASFILPGAYPQMVSKAEAAAFARRLRSPEIAAKGAEVVAEKATGLRDAVQDYVDGLEAAGRTRDLAAIFAKAHDIRGVAGNAGLTAAGRIAEGLCRYLGEVQRAGMTPDDAVVRLHINAIARAARAKDESTRMGDAVAAELAALVVRRLRDVKD